MLLNLPYNALSNYLPNATPLLLSSSVASICWGATYLVVTKVARILCKYPSKPRAVLAQGCRGYSPMGYRNPVRTVKLNSPNDTFMTIQSYHPEINHHTRHTIFQEYVIRADHSSRILKCEMESFFFLDQE